MSSITFHADGELEGCENDRFQRIGSETVEAINKVLDICRNSDDDFNDFISAMMIQFIKDYDELVLKAWEEATK